MTLVTLTQLTMGADLPQPPLRNQTLGPLNVLFFTTQHFFGYGLSLSARWPYDGTTVCCCIAYARYILRIPAHWTAVFIAWTVCPRYYCGYHHHAASLPTSGPLCHPLYRQRAHIAIIAHAPLHLSSPSTPVVHHCARQLTQTCDCVPFSAKTRRAASQRTVMIPPATPPHFSFRPWITTCRHSLIRRIRCLH